MNRIFYASVTILVGLFMMACEPAGNTVNKTANTANSAAPVNTAAVEADIKKLVADMATALTKGDYAAFEKMYTDNYMFVGPDGTVVTGQQRIASMKTGETKYESVAYDEVVVRTNTDGTGAVSISKATVKGKNMGKPVDGQFRVTHVWSKANDGWRLASGQTTPMAAAAGAMANTTSAPKAMDKAKMAEQLATDDAATDDLQRATPKR